MKSTLRYLTMLLCLVVCWSCDNTIAPAPDPMPETQEDILRFYTKAGTTFSSIDLYAFIVSNAGDTVLYSVLPPITGPALSNPYKLGLPMGSYVLVAVANTDARIVSPTPGLTLISDLMAELTTNAQQPAFYDQAGEWYWGINKDIKIGQQSVNYINLNRIINKVVLTYNHGDPYMTGLTWRIDGLSKKQYFNNDLSSEQNQGISVIKTPSVTVGQNVLQDSILILPSVDASSTIYLTHTRLIDGITKVKNYKDDFSEPFKANYITYVTVNGGEETDLSVTEAPWIKDTANYILDEAPASAVTINFGGFTQVETDTTYLQSIDVRVAVNLGVLTNYTSNFAFTINKLAPTTGTLVKNVAMKVVNGKLMTTTPVRLSRGDYQITAYKLNDVEGALPDPNGKAITKNFTVDLGYQIVDLSLDGRQAVDNAILRQVADSLQGLGTTPGQYFPGTTQYANEPLGTTLPGTSATTKYSSWYTGPSNFVQMTPIRGEWRAYSINYRLNTNKLSGTLPSIIGQLSRLYLINLNGNLLTGGIPTGIGNAKNLNTLILSNNNMSGVIDNLLPITTLRRLSLENNSFSGTLAPGLNNFGPLLNYISINNNNFTGDVSLINLSVGGLFIQNNQLSGSFPAFGLAVAGTTASHAATYNNFTCYASTIANPSRINPQRSGNIAKCP